MQRTLLIVGLCLAFETGHAASARVNWPVVRHALGQVESGNNDFARGSQGEVSRYQILPEIWRAEVRSGKNRPRSTQEQDAWNVTQRVLERRANRFATVTGRPPNSRELYALWNAPSDLLARGYGGLNRRVRERCERFSNLVAGRAMHMAEAR